MLRFDLDPFPELKMMVKMNVEKNPQIEIKIRSCFSPNVYLTQFDALT